MIFKVLFSAIQFCRNQTGIPEFMADQRTETGRTSRFGQMGKNLSERPSVGGKIIQYYIRLVWRWETCSPMIDMNCSVYDKVDNHLDCPMACYPSWSEIAGMEVVVEKDIVITPQELVAGLLWEITYFGGTEEIVRKNMERTFHGGTK